MSRTILSVLFVVLLGAAATSCNPFEPRACTLIGCHSGLRVQLEGTPDAPYTIRATAADGESESVGCSEPTGCPLFFRDFMPGKVTISYESAAGTVVQTFTPEYVTSRPNGENCPPECVNATVVLELTP